jgi:hypothetical protein
MIDGIDTAIWIAYAALTVGINVLKAGFAKFINLYNGNTILTFQCNPSFQFLIVDLKYDSDGRFKYSVRLYFVLLADKMVQAWWVMSRPFYSVSP